MTDVDVVEADGATGGGEATGSGAEVSARLAELVGQRRQLEKAIDDEIDQLAHQKISWPVIAAALGVSRQAARQRHHRRTARP